MYQKIGHENYGVVFIFAYRYLNDFTVFFCNYAVDCKRYCYPLIFLYTPVIMCVEVHDLGILIYGVLFHI